jgi:hypothetical protein
MITPRLCNQFFDKIVGWIYDLSAADSLAKQTPLRVLGRNPGAYTFEQM